MNRGLRILVEDALLPFDQALNSCTINPARCLGVDDRKGKLVLVMTPISLCWKTITMWHRRTAGELQCCNRMR